MKGFLLAILISIPIFLVGQKYTKVNKYAVGFEVGIGHSFPNFDREQDRWKGSFYPAGGFNLLFTNRINERWISDLGIGITGYSLINKGITDSYVLDFASPTISSGISYNFQNRRGQENFIKLTSGLQLGYQGKFVDEFETYTVEIEGKNKLYQFIRPEIGIRRYFNERMRGSRYKMAYEFGTFFRYNINTLGTATIYENDFDVSLEPRGNILGAYFKILFPVGKEPIKIKNSKQEELPPKIISPRTFR